MGGRTWVLSRLVWLLSLSFQHLLQYLLSNTFSLSSNKWFSFFFFLKNKTKRQKHTNLVYELIDYHKANITQKRKSTRPPGLETLCTHLSPLTAPTVTTFLTFKESLPISFFFLIVLLPKCASLDRIFWPIWKVDQSLGAVLIYAFLVHPLYFLARVNQKHLGVCGISQSTLPSAHPGSSLMSPLLSLCKLEAGSGDSTRLRWCFVCA